MTRAITYATVGGTIAGRVLSLLSSGGTLITCLMRTSMSEFSTSCGTRTTDQWMASRPRVNAHVCGTVCRRVVEVSVIETVHESRAHHPEGGRCPQHPATQQCQ